MRKLTVLYDEGCALCRRARAFLEARHALVTLEFLAAGSPSAVARYGRLESSGEELWVIDDQGQAWVGPPAFVMCLWALDETRGLAELLSTPLLQPLARRFFRALSAERRHLSAFLDDSRCGEHGCTLHADHGDRSPYRRDAEMPSQRDA